MTKNPCNSSQVIGICLENLGKEVYWKSPFFKRKHRSYINKYFAIILPGHLQLNRGAKCSYDK